MLKDGTNGVVNVRHWRPGGEMAGQQLPRQIIVAVGVAAHQAPERKEPDRRHVGGFGNGLAKGGLTGHLGNSHSLQWDERRR